MNIVENLKLWRYDKLKQDEFEEKVDGDRQESFGYIPSIIFLVFIGFVLYISLKG